MANRSAMPCRSDEEFAQGPDEPNAVTPPRRRINDGACREKSDVEISDENDEHEVANPEKTKRGARTFILDHCQDLGHL